MNMNTIRPIGLHVAGVVRFASEGAGTEDFRQLDHFEVLGRAYEPSPVDGGEAPKLKLHPLNDRLLEKQAEPSSAERKLRSIPVKLLFNDPENSLSARYESFDTDLNRLVCTGDGTTCVRADVSSGELKEHPCAGPDACLYANEAGRSCGLRVRLTVQIDGQDDPLSVFEVQSSGIHTYRNFAAKLATLKALIGRLRGVPLALRLYERGSPAHGYKSFWVADLGLRDNASLESLATGTEEASAVQYDALENAVATMRKEATFALVDDVEAGLITYRPALPVNRDRKQRASSAPEVTIESVVASARARAAAEQQEKPAVVSEIVLPAGAVASAATSRGQGDPATVPMVGASFQMAMAPQRYTTSLNAKIDFPPAQL